MTPIEPISAATAGVLSGAAALHVAWGLGSTWPLPNAAALADTVVGSASVPPPTACFAVAGALGTAAALVLGFPPQLPHVRKAGQLGVALVLGTRAVFGFAGRTNQLSPGSESPQFQYWDRRLFSPLCLALAAGAAHSLTR